MIEIIDYVSDLRAQISPERGGIVLLSDDGSWQPAFGWARDSGRAAASPAPAALLERAFSERATLVVDATGVGASFVDLLKTYLRMKRHKLMPVVITSWHTINRQPNSYNVPREILLPVQIVERSNCAAWDRPIEARELPKWESVVGA